MGIAIHIGYLGSFKSIISFGLSFDENTFLKQELEYSIDDLQVLDSKNNGDSNERLEDDSSKHDRRESR